MWVERTWASKSDWNRPFRPEGDWSFLIFVFNMIVRRDGEGWTDKPVTELSSPSHQPLVFIDIYFQPDFSYRLQMTFTIIFLITSFSFLFFRILTSCFLFLIRSWGFHQLIFVFLASTPTTKCYGLPCFSGQGSYKKITQFLMKTQKRTKGADINNNNKKKQHYNEIAALRWQFKKLKKDFLNLRWRR